MPLEADIRATIDSYARSDMRTREWHTGYFDFIEDRNLRHRLGEEFYTARYLYKLLEGLAVEGELQIAQVRLQVLQYASIYEAAIHHLLFDALADHPEVRELGRYRTLKRYSIPAIERKKWPPISHDDKEIIPAYEAVQIAPQTKIRFDDKAHCAGRIGLIEPWLRDELVSLYEARNSIHIHADIRKNVDWELELARNAYRRHEPFRAQVLSFLAARVR